MKKVYIFLADGFEEVEGLTQVDLLRRAGAEVTTVSIMKKTEIDGAHGIRLQADAVFEDCDFSDGDLFVLPGGQPGTTNLSKHEALGSLLKDKAKEEKYIAAICAAPMVLGGLGLLNGRKAICYPGCEGGLGDAIVTKEKVVTDGNITTSMGVGSAIPFGLRLIAILFGQEKSDQIKKSICFGHLSEL